MGIVNVRLDDFFRQWDGVTAVLSPPSENYIRSEQQSRSWSLKLKSASQDVFNYAGLNWFPLAWISLVISYVGLLNAFYSLNYAKYLQSFWPFIYFAVAYTLTTGLLNWLSNLLQAKMLLRYSELLGYKIRDSLPTMDEKFYTIGDISTRYHDIMIIINSIMGLFRDIPYSLMIFSASIFFLCRISWLLGLFVVAFLTLLTSVLSPFVKKVQNYTYTIKIREAEMMNKLQQFIGGASEEVTGAWEETNRTVYRQALWNIPISSVVGNSTVLPVLFVVIFLQWKTGGFSAYQDILSALMIMSYAVQAGHTLYSRYVAWQTAQPSFHRLKDFLEIDQKEAQLEESKVS